MKKCFKVTLKKTNYTIKYLTDADDGDFVFVAICKGKQIAVAVFNEYSNGIQSDHTEVDSNHRRKGVASAMYDLAQQVSNIKVVPAEECQTDDALAFWKARKKSNNQLFSNLT